MASLLFLQNLEYEFLAPMYISSMAKRHGHECNLAIGETVDDVRAVIERTRPDLVGFSIMSGSHSCALAVARQVKASSGRRQSQSSEQ